MKSINEEAIEFFSHNPQCKRVGFLMVDEYDLMEIENGDAMYLCDKDITIIENPVSEYEKEMKELEEAGLLTIVEIPNVKESHEEKSQ